MKTRIILWFFFFGVVTTSGAQEYFLKLEKVKNGYVRKTRIFEEGTVLILRTTNGIRQKGIFAIKDNESIILNNGAIIQLKDIKKVRSPNGKLAGGLTLFTLGSLAFSGGLLGMAVEDIFGDDSNSNAEIVTVAGLASFTTGIVLMSHHNYKPKNGIWRISIGQK